MEMKKTVKQLDYIHALRRLHVHRLATQKDMYPGQMHIMGYLERHDSSTQKEIADFLHVSPSCIAVSVKRMIKSGLVSRAEDGEDRRTRHLTLTPRGREIAVSMRVILESVDKMMFEGFSEEDMENFSSYLMRIQENLSTDETNSENIFGLLAKGTELLTQKEND